MNELYYSKVESELMLPFLPLKTHEFNDYWGEMNYCIAFAKCNRQSCFPQWGVPNRGLRLQADSIQ